MKEELSLSSLGHTWLFDIDGTIVKHNGYKIDGHDTLLEGVKELFDSIPEGDYIIFLTSRKNKYKAQTEEFLKAEGLRFNKIIYDLPYGERILLNDDKPSGLSMGISINSKRDQWCGLDIRIDNNR